jgi:flagellar FliJ protein
MAKPFALAGLLRLRQVQQDQAAGDLASAARHHRENSVREREARAALGAQQNEVVDTSVLLALAASRAAAQSLIAELAAVTSLRADRLRAAERAFAESRARTLSLEKLESRHSHAVALGDQRTEQAALDEIAGRSAAASTPHTAPGLPGETAS